MAQCKNCGREVGGVAYCPYCGYRMDGAYQMMNTQNPQYVQYVQIQQQKQPTAEELEGPGLSIAALIFSILGGWIGFVLSIIGMCTSKKASNKARSEIGLAISILWIIAQVIVIIIVCAETTKYLSSY